MNDVITTSKEIAQKIKLLKKKGYDEGYIAGREKEWSDFWDAYQNYGKRSSYTFAFSHGGWDDITFIPKYDIITSGYAASMFYDSNITDMAKLLEECGVILDTSRSSSFDNFCASSTITYMPPVDLSKCTVAKHLFKDCANLKSAPLKNIKNVPNWTNAFFGCTKLTDIGQKSDDFGYFSASVDLSQTAIDFSTYKMSLFAVLDKLVAGKEETITQADSFVLLRPTAQQTLTISTMQRDQIDAYVKERTWDALDYSHIEGAFTYINWAVAVV